MKKILISLTFFLVMMSGTVSAQTWDEWVHQGRTQRRYLTQQIALLKVYLEHIKKGVTIVRKGLTTIENVKNGDFNLHRDFFSSLKKVNPHISTSAKVADIIAFQVFIVQELNKVNSYCRNNQEFTPEEVRYVADVYANMLYLTDASLSELYMIIFPDKTIMNDDERLARIDVLYDNALDKHAFVQSFGHDVQTIANERASEKHQLAQVKMQHGLP